MFPGCKLEEEGICTALEYSFEVLLSRPSVPGIKFIKGIYANYDLHSVLTFRTKARSSVPYKAQSKGVEGECGEWVCGMSDFHTEDQR